MHDFPANPITKPGYRLEFHDEFSGHGLDTRKWLPYYLPQWSSREQSAPRLRMEEGTLVLQITQDQPPWCPEFDGHVRCSSLQTGVLSGPVGSSVGQHRFHADSVVREAQPNIRTYTPRYGYFEIRAKAVASPSNHVSLWMIGYEESPEQSAEIAIMEIMGEDVHACGSRIGYGVHPWGDPTIVDEFYREAQPIDASKFHIYAAEWTPTHIDFYIDNRKVRTIAQSPRYAMQFMLGIYERPGTNAELADPPYPKRFVVDYFRAYQPEGGYRNL